MSNLFPILSSSPPPLDDGPSFNDGWADDVDEDFGTFSSVASIGVVDCNHIVDTKKKKCVGGLDLSSFHPDKVNSNVHEDDITAFSAFDSSSITDTNNKCNDDNWANFCSESPPDFSPFSDVQSGIGADSSPSSCNNFDAVEHYRVSPVSDSLVLNEELSPHDQISNEPVDTGVSKESISNSIDKVKKRPDFVPTNLQPTDLDIETSTSCTIGNSKCEDETSQDSVVDSGLSDISPLPKSEEYPDFSEDNRSCDYFPDLSDHNASDKQPNQCELSRGGVTISGNVDTEITPNDSDNHACNNASFHNNIDNPDINPTMCEYDSDNAFHLEKNATLDFRIPEGEDCDNKCKFSDQHVNEDCDSEIKCRDYTIRTVEQEETDAKGCSDNSSSHSSHTSLNLENIEYKIDTHCSSLSDEYNDSQTLQGTGTMLSKDNLSTELPSVNKDDVKNESSRAMEFQSSQTVLQNLQVDYEQDNIDLGSRDALSEDGDAEEQFNNFADFNSCQDTSVVKADGDWAAFGDSDGDWNNGVTQLESNDDDNWADFSRPSAPLTNREEALNDQNSDFGDFEATKAGQHVDGDFTDTKDTDDDFGDFEDPSSEDFGDFSTPASITNVPQTLPSVVSVSDKITGMVDKCFPDEYDSDVLSVICKLTDVIMQEKKKILADEKKKDKLKTRRQPPAVEINSWKNLHDTENTNALSYQWAESKSYGKLLNALHIDPRNILHGHKKPAVPIFASNLGLLEPSREPAQKKTEKLEPALIDTSKESTTQLPPLESLPPVEFDWGSSGLTNPLDSSNSSCVLDLDFFTKNSSNNSTITTKTSALENEFLSSFEPSTEKTETKPVNPLESILASMKSTITNNNDRDEENLSPEATDIVASLPSLSFMKARVLMFPLKSPEFALSPSNETINSRLVEGDSS